MVKLDSKNYIIWKMQVQNILQATYLFGYLDGSINCPASIVQDSNGKDVANLEFLKWKVFNSHLLNCLTATLTTPVFSLVLDLSSSREVWLSLEKCFTTLSRSHIHQLKDRLSTVDKGTKSMEDYLKQIKDLADQLAMASSPIHDEDLVFHVLHGLPEAYDAFKTSIRTRSEPISVDELTSLLCSEAIHIDAHSKGSNRPSDLTVVFSAVTTSHKSPGSSSYSGFCGYSFMNRGRFSPRTGFQGSRFGDKRGGRGFGSGHNNFSNYREFRASSDFRAPHLAGDSSGYASSSGSSVVCQICQKLGHTAVHCKYRMDSAFQSSSISTTSPSTAKAFVALASPTPSPDWYLDSVATHHLTNDLSNLNFYQPYHGSEQVMVGNGAAMPIQHSGKGLLPTPTNSFHLNHVYHVPSLSNNLVSVQQLTKDNNCTVTRKFCLKVILIMASISFILLLFLLHLSVKHCSTPLLLPPLGIADLVIHHHSNFNNLLSIYSCLLLISVLLLTVHIVLCVRVIACLLLCQIPLLIALFL